MAPRLALCCQNAGSRRGCRQAECQSVRTMARRTQYIRHTVTCRSNLCAVTKYRAPTCHGTITCFGLPTRQGSRLKRELVRRSARLWRRLQRIAVKQTLGRCHCHFPTESYTVTLSVRPSLSPPLAQSSSFVRQWARPPSAQRSRPAQPCLRQRDWRTSSLGV